MRKLQLYAWGYLLSLVLMVCGCAEDNPPSTVPCFEKEYYEMQLFYGLQRIAFNGSSDRFSIQNLNPDIIEISSIEDGYLKFTPLRKGTATLLVKDKLGDASTTIRIKMVDKYLCFYVRDHYTVQHPFYGTGSYMFLVNDEKRTAYLYDDSFNLKEKGTYAFELNNGRYYFSALYTKESFVYDITSSDRNVLLGIPYYLDFQWSEDEPRQSTREAAPDFMTAIDIETNITYNFVLRSSIEMPYHVLD